ncbi:MAG: transporter substrate-binding domain-containing protein, partial [Lachnospiraceae bacterium]|nr:transporter substrate-binding domain-containing protein [Lachnospiraceae bacterium]
MKNNLIKKIITAVAAATLGAALLTGCGSTGATSAEGASADNSGNQVYRTLDEIKESGTVNIGVFSDKNPFGYVDENGTYQGYDVYFAERIGQDLGVKINYVSTEAASRVEYLETGKVDIVLANFTVTEERAQKVDFALPY